MYRKVKATSSRLGKADKIVLTGFISDEEHFCLLKSCRAIVVLTSREYTLLRTLGGCSTGKTVYSFKN